MVFLLQKMKTRVPAGDIHTVVQPQFPCGDYSPFPEVLEEIARKRQAFHPDVANCCVRLQCVQGHYFRVRMCDGTCKCCVENGDKCVWLAVETPQTLKKRERDFPEGAEELYERLKKEGPLFYHELAEFSDEAMNFLVDGSFVQVRPGDNTESDLYSVALDQDLDNNVLYDETLRERVQHEESTRRSRRVHWSLGNALSYLDDHIFDPERIREIKALVEPAMTKALMLDEN